MVQHDWRNVGREVVPDWSKVQGRKIMFCARCSTEAVRTSTGCYFRLTGGAPDPVHPSCDVQAVKMVMAS